MPHFLLFLHLLLPASLLSFLSSTKISLCSSFFFSTSNHIQRVPMYFFRIQVIIIPISYLHFQILQICCLIHLALCSGTIFFIPVLNLFLKAREVLGIKHPCKSSRTSCLGSNTQSLGGTTLYLRMHLTVPQQKQSHFRSGKFAVGLGGGS